MPGLLSTLWSIIRSIRYLMPFLAEASKDYNPNDNEDRIVTENLRSMIRTFIWYVFIGGMALIFLVFYVIPLAAENKLLQHELDEETLERREIEVRFNKIVKEHQLRGENHNRTLTQLEFTNNELKTVRELYTECKESNAQFKMMLNRNRIHSEISQEQNNTGEISPTPKEQETKK